MARGASIDAPPTVARIEVCARVARQTSQNVAWGTLSRCPPFLSLHGRPHPLDAGNTRRSMGASRERACALSGSVVRVLSCSALSRAIPLFPVTQGDGRFGLISSTAHAQLGGILRSQSLSGRNRWRSSKRVEFLLKCCANGVGATLTGKGGSRREHVLGRATGPRRVRVPAAPQIVSADGAAART